MKLKIYNNQSGIEIDFGIQLSDVVKEAQKYYPLAKNGHIACFNYWHAQSERLQHVFTPSERYNANLKFKLLSLLMLTVEQFN